MTLSSTSVFAFLAELPSMPWMADVLPIVLVVGAFVLVLNRSKADGVLKALWNNITEINIFGILIRKKPGDEASPTQTRPSPVEENAKDLPTSARQYSSKADITPTKGPQAQWVVPAVGALMLSAAAVLIYLPLVRGEVGAAKRLDIAEALQVPVVAVESRKDWATTKVLWMNNAARHLYELDNARYDEDERALTYPDTGRAITVSTLIEKQAEKRVGDLDEGHAQYKKRILEDLSQLQEVNGKYQRLTPKALNKNGVLQMTQISGRHIAEPRMVGDRLIDRPFWLFRLEILRKEHVHTKEILKSWAEAE